MLPLAPLLALLLIVTPPGPGRASAIAAVPDEPGAVVLPNATILQTVVADLDDDGRRELVRLVRGDGDAVLTEIWGEDRGDGWRLRGEPLEVVPPSRIGARIDRVYQSTPVRLLVRRVGDGDRVTVASQPHFEEIDVGPPCCLLLHDLELVGGVGVRRAVSGPTDFADAVIVIDLDGDRTDELLATRSLPPDGDIGFPILARVHRWVGGEFSAPTVTRLPVGSGDSPFRLGDSDGLPGDEAGINSTLGPPGLFRIRMTSDDALEQDAAGVVVDAAIAVPLGEERGVALTGPVSGLMVGTWPAGEAVSEPRATAQIADGRIVGTVVVRGQPRLVVHQPLTEAVHLLGLPDLIPPLGPITRSPAAAALSDQAFQPFSGPLPGGGPGGEPTVIHAGRLIPSPAGDEGPGTSLMASLAGAEPVGLVGDASDSRIVLHHGFVGQSAPGPDGGALVVPAPLDRAWTSIAPFDLARAPEAGGAHLDPPLRDAVELEARGSIATGPGGFRAEVRAPPGSRVIVADLDPSVVRTSIVVPESGVVQAPLVPPAVAIPNPRYRARILVLTPAGHAHLAALDVRVRSEPPAVDLRVATRLGSGIVDVTGSTDRHATVRVAGRPAPVSDDGRFVVAVELPPWPTEVVVEVDDRVGNVARHTVTGIGYFDYRALPWLPITALLVAVLGVGIFLRVPRSIPTPGRADDDAALEELEPE